MGSLTQGVQPCKVLVSLSFSNTDTSVINSDVICVIKDSGQSLILGLAALAFTGCQAVRSLQVGDMLN